MDRDLFGLKIWDRYCCVIRGEGCHPAPPPDLRKGPLQVDRQLVEKLTAISSSIAVEA
jgi:hypothetical protein